MPYAVLRPDDMETHVYSTSHTSLRSAREFISFCRKHYNDKNGTYVIYKLVEEHRKPRRWRLE